MLNIYTIIALVSKCIMHKKKKTFSSKDKFDRRHRTVGSVCNNQ